MSLERPDKAARNTAPVPGALATCLPRSVRYFLISVLTGTLLTLASAAVHLPPNGHGAGFSPLFPESPGFDFYDYIPRFQLLHHQQFFTASGYPWYYPPAASFVHYPFYAIPGGFGLYLATAFALIYLLARQFYRSLERKPVPANRRLALVLIPILCSWPLYFALQRGNIEAITWPLSAIGIWAVSAKRPNLAAVLFGIAGAIKIYPLIFVALLISRKRYGAVTLSLATAVILSLLGLRLLEPDVSDAYHRSLSGVRAWTTFYSEQFRPDNADYDHSLFGIVKAALHLRIADFHHLLPVYLVIGAVGASLLYMGRVIRLPFQNQVLFLCCACVVLPPTSFDYTLPILHAAYACLLLAAFTPDGRDTAAERITFVLLGLVTTPLMFLASPVAPGLPGVTRGLMLFCLGLLASWRPFFQKQLPLDTSLREEDLRDALQVSL